MKSPIPHPFLVRLTSRPTARILRTAVFLTIGSVPAAYAGTADTLTATASATANLTTGSDWSLTTAPTSANDAIFSSASTAATTRSITSSNVTWGSFNLTATSGAWGITNNGSTASTLTLGGGSTTNSVSGSNSVDLIYLAAGTETMLFANGTHGTLGLILGQSGNFNLGAGTALTVSSALNLSTYTLTLAGSGGSTFSGAISGTTTAGSTAISLTGGASTFSGNNSYSGITSVGTSILTISANYATALGASGAGNGTTVSNCGYIRYQNPSTATVNERFTLSGAVGPMARSKFTMPPAAASRSRARSL